MKSQIIKACLLVLAVGEVAYTAREKIIIKQLDVFNSTNRDDALANADGNSNPIEVSDQIVHQINSSELDPVDNRNKLLGGPALNNLEASSESLPDSSNEPDVINQGKSSDLVVVLDLDECLIHSIIYTANGTYLDDQNHKFAPSARPVKSMYNFTVADVVRVDVYKRPFIDEFLQALSERYEIHLFTAGLLLFNGPVVKMLDPNSTIFTKVWDREYCSYDPDTHKYVKNLTMYWGDRLKRTVLIDNNIFSFLSNPENGIPIPEFYDNADDDFLMPLLELLNYLDSKPDVRTSLDHRFHMREALRSVTVGNPSFAKYNL